MATCARMREQKRLANASKPTTVRDVSLLTKPEALAP